MVTHSSETVIAFI